MKNRIGRVLALLLFLAVPAKVFAAVFNPETFTLANGLKIVIVHNALAGAFVQMLWIKAGGADDPPGKSGLAHYLEHLMFKGTNNLAAGAFSSDIARRGGQDNASTTQETTAYHVTLSPEYLGFSFQMEAERLANLLIDPHEAATELDVVINERRERTQNDPIGAFYEKFNAAFWGDHPYGTPTIGSENEIRNLTPQDARAFYKRFYTPQNAVLVVAGNVNTADVLRLAAGTFGRISSGTQRATIAIPPPSSLPAKDSLTVHDPRVHQPFYIMRVRAPSFAENPVRAMALEVLAEVLDGGEVGTLYRHFVMGKGTAIALDVSYDSFDRSAAVLSLAATPATTTSPAALARDIKAYLKALAHEGVPAREVNAAKKRLLDMAVFARDDIMAPAQILGSALVKGYSVRDVEVWPVRIKSVTPEQVTEALRALLAEKHTMTGFLLAEEKP